MTRPLRLEYPGALYHVTSRGIRAAAIYRDDSDRLAWLQILADVCSHFDFAVHSFCQMGNHYHLMLETKNGGLSRGMRALNGNYSQYFNRRHALYGHVFQGRYKAILVQRDSYLLELARYIVLNPVRAQLVDRPGDWPWSSYRLMTEATPSPAWLDTQWLLARFAPDKADAINRYREFVTAGIGSSTRPLAQVRHQLILGDDAFIAHVQTLLPMFVDEGISDTQRRALLPTLADYAKGNPDRDKAMAQAYATGSFSVTIIAQHFKVSHKTAARAIKRWTGP